jgi:hypothetical protein
MRANCRIAAIVNRGRMTRLRVEHGDESMTADQASCRRWRGVRRRDFINIAAVSWAGVGGAVALPLVNQMNPSADVLALASIEVDVSAISRVRRSRRAVPQAAGVRPQPDPEGNRRGQQGAMSARCAIRRRWPNGPRKARKTG